MIDLEINGKSLKANEGDTILDVAKKAGIHIPTLCHHDGVEGWGGCRICMVEITHKSWKGWKGLVTACLYPVEQGLVVTTDNEEVHNVRKVVLDLLLARSPKADAIKKMAAEYGIEKTSYAEASVKTTCILCTLCVRVCKAVGPEAISTCDRGADKKIAMPFMSPPPDCIGCLSCARICPTDTIKFKESPLERKIWTRTFKMAKCEGCGVVLMTQEQIEYEMKKTGLDRDHYSLCPECKKKKLVDRISSAFTNEN